MQRTATLALSLATLLLIACGATDEKPAASGDASAAATAARADAPARQASAGLPLGTYQCLDTYTEVGENMKVTYKEELIVEDEDTYRYRKDGEAGEYAFDAATGEIRWLSGPYAGGNPTGKYEKKADTGREVITLGYTFEGLGSDEDFCFRRTDA